MGQLKMYSNEKVDITFTVLRYFHELNEDTKCKVVQT